MEILQRVYRALRRRGLVPSGLRKLLFHLRSMRQTLSHSPDLVNELNLVRLALGELKDDLSHKGREIGELRERMERLSAMVSDRIRMFTLWASAAQEGRDRRQAG